MNDIVNYAEMQYPGDTKYFENKEGGDVNIVATDEGDESYCRIESKVDQNAQYYLNSLSSHNLDIPTEEEQKTLRRVLGSAPLYAYLVCLVEFAERGSYYSVSEALTKILYSDHYRMAVEQEHL